MQDLISIFVKSIFVDNMIFAYFLGMCSFLAISKNVKAASGLGIMVLGVLLISVPVNWLLDRYVLAPGALVWLNPEYANLDLSFLSLIVFIAVLAALVQILEMITEKYTPALYSALGIFLPLLAIHCAIFGGSLFMQERGYETIWEAIIFALGSGIGWYIAVVAIAAIREKLSYSHIPKALKGLGITFILTGLMGLAFMSFMGIQI